MTTTTQPAGASDAAIAQELRHIGGGLLALYKGGEQVKEIGVTPGWDFRDRDEVIIRYNEYEQLRNAATPPAQVAGSGMGELIAAASEAAETLIVWLGNQHPTVKRLQAALTAQPAPVVGGELRERILDSLNLFYQLGKAGQPNESAAKADELAALSARPAVEGGAVASYVPEPRTIFRSDGACERCGRCREGDFANCKGIAND
jgi:hypothetical protein